MRARKGWTRSLTRWLPFLAVLAFTFLYAVFSLSQWHRWEVPSWDNAIFTQLLQSYAAGPPYYDQSFPTYPDYAQFQADLAGVLEKADGRDTQAAGTAASSSVGAADAARAGTGPAAGVSAAGTSTVRPALTRVPSEEQLSPNGTCSVP